MDLFSPRNNDADAHIPEVCEDRLGSGYTGIRITSTTSN